MNPPCSRNLVEMTFLGQTHFVIHFSSFSSCRFLCVHVYECVGVCFHLVGRHCKWTLQMRAGKYQGYRWPAQHCHVDTHGQVGTGIL